MTDSTKAISLGDLAFACYVYEAMTGFDESVAEFRTATAPGVDLRSAEHGLHLLHWLNHWGCRLATAHHDMLSVSLAIWYKVVAERLPGPDVRLVSMKDSKLEVFAEIFDSLRGLTAAEKTHGGHKYSVSFGPTAAAKTLFALRPHVFVAWDDAIRSELGHDGSGASYVRFLADVREKLGALANRGVNLDKLPLRLGRPHSTAAELIDEYYWVTITKGATPPEPALLQEWMDWSIQG